VRNSSRFCWIYAFAAFASILSAAQALAAPNDWAEGSRGDEGATRDYYHRAALLAWRNFFGDWHDADDKPQGDQPFASAAATARDGEKPLEWDVTALARKWQLGEFPNQGLLLRGTSGGGTYLFHSREADDAARRPALVVTTSGRLGLRPDSSGKEGALPAAADTYLEKSTYRGQGTQPVLRISSDNHALLRFDLSRLARDARIEKAVLRLFASRQ
jgi:hypothetical protein